MKKILFIQLLAATVTVLSLLGGCSSTSGDFIDDVIFMQKHTPVVLLKDGNSAVAVAPDYQGRVMTSTFDYKSGPSFGWINRPVIEQGFLSDEEKQGKLEEHIYIFGGEERFWLGPEGGQYALFFEFGAKFGFSGWLTPPVIDTEAFKLISQSERSVTFKHQTELVNYSGTQFKVGIDRRVSLLDTQQIEKLLGVELPADLSLVAYG